MADRRLMDRVATLDRSRLALLDQVEALDAGQLSVKSHPDKWSVLEIVEHLVRAERDVLQRLVEPTALVSRPRRFKDRVNYYLVLAVLTAEFP